MTFCGVFNKISVKIMNPLINLMHLKFFCDAVTCSSISESAKKNYVTQSAVSQAIAKLEQILGVELTIHSRQRFQPTEEGVLLFEQSRQIFKAVQETYDQIHQKKESVTGILNFACTNSLGMSFMARAHNRMQETYPSVQLNMKLGNLTFIRQALRHNEVELAVVVYDETFSNFTKTPLKKGAFGLYQHESAPPKLAETILVDEWEGMYVQEMIGHFKRANIKAALGGWEVVARFAEHSMGAGFFPDYLMAHGRYPMLKSSMELPSFEYEIAAIYNKGDRLSRAAQRFIELFKEDGCASSTC